MTMRSQMPRPAGDKPLRKHLPAAERERHIIQAAAEFFARYGFEAQTRELARTMGISHPAIFRYFPSKDALIERVYDHVFLARWDAGWKDLLLDRTRPLEDRLVCFYSAYAERIFDPQWMRIFMFAGLKGHPMTGRYVTLVRNQIIKPACAELRAESNLPPLAKTAMTAREEEAFWGLHGAVFYLGIRTFIYEVRTPIDRAGAIRDHVRIFLNGARETLDAPKGRSIRKA